MPYLHSIIILVEVTVNDLKKDRKKRYQRALKACTLNLKNVSKYDPHQSALHFFRMGVALSRMGELEGAVRCFSDAFIIREYKRELDHNSLYYQFHQAQMSRYIEKKRNKVISTLAEGDMIHELIKNRWQQLLIEIETSQFNFQTDDLTIWFRSIKIDFPWEMEDFDPDEQLVESN